MFKVVCDGGWFGKTKDRTEAGNIWKYWIQFFHNMAQKNKGTEDYKFYVHCFNTLEIVEAK